MSEPDAPRRSSPAVAWTAGAVSVVLVLQVLSAWRVRTAEQRLDELGARLEKAAVELEQVPRRIEALEARLEPVMRLADEWDMLVDDVQKTGRRIDDVIRTLEDRDGSSGGDGTPQPPELDWTQPELFEAARRAADAVGIELTPDEVRVPARFAQKQGVLEYFAVLKGGKEHESLLSLTGNTGADERRPAEFGARLNNAIQALGFRRGQPIRFTPTGTRPAQGEPVHLFVEWQEGGETVVVRAEDLVWDRERDAPMQPGSWVYVGSSWIADGAPDELVFAADITGEAVATYSAVNTIIDNVAPGAQDDTVFLVATPRLPVNPEGLALLIRRTDRLPTRTFPDPAPADGGAGGR